MGLNPVQAWILFQALFCQLLISCIHNYDDLLCIYICPAQGNNMMAKTRLEPPSIQIISSVVQRAVPSVHCHDSNEIYRPSSCGSHVKSQGINNMQLPSLFLRDNMYQDLALEIKRVHGATKVAVIPIAIGALGTISKKAKLWYGRLSLPDIFGSVQLSAILGTAHILWKVLCF